MRYTASVTGKCDVRMSLILDPFYLKELGVIAGADASVRAFGSVAASPWRWPTASMQWPLLAESLVPAVVDGVTWLESLLDLRTLAAHLETQRRFGPEVDVEMAVVLDRMKAAGIQTIRSPGLDAPRAGRLRPDKVKALSYCYELIGDWERAVAAWKDYLSTFQKTQEEDLLRLGQLEERLSGRGDR